jgi:hypothetical protein
MIATLTLLCWKDPMRVRTAPLTIVAALIITFGLSACSPVSNAAQSCTPLLAAGSVSDRVVVLGENGTMPEVSLPGESSPSISQRTIVQRAENRDRVVAEGDLVTVNFGFYDGLSGQQVFATPGFGTDSGGFIVQDLPDTEISAFTTSFRCAAVGDRLVVALSPQDSLAFAQGYGVMPGSAIIAVADVQGVAGVAAEGAVRALPSGFPGIAVNENGRPCIVIPPGAEPTQLRSALRIEGAGAKVRDQDIVIAQVLTVGWNGEIVENSWESGPRSLGSIEQPLALFRDQITGAPVGSQLIVMVPSESGVQVSVVDILSVG